MTESQFLYRMRFRSFVDFAFRELHPDESFVRNWHIDLMTEMLQMMHLERGHDLRRVIFNLPPGYLKTHICSVSFPAWLLGRDPRKSVLILSEDPEPAFEIQERCAELIGSQRFRSVFPRARIKKASRSLELDYGGWIRHAGIGYSSRHTKSDIVIIDNPQSLHSLDRIKPEHFAEIGRLLKQPKEGLIVMNTRRIAATDLSWFFHVKLNGWGRVSIPAVALEDETWSIPPDINHVQKKGDLLCFSLEGWEDIQGHLAAMGGEAFSYQYLQGQYSPPTSGEIELPDRDGMSWRAIGNFDPTWSTQRHLEKLRVLETERRKALYEGSGDGPFDTSSFV
ncbi:hypothetical protein OKA04_00105 [Luteolibacter flavescens]|uniref:Terminase large subunit gp17-like C-terminal domain-containing protein n=1 Tax=Luteolibacter flavescens TaxID=1859460 RepID=A0ABT3FID2_9BACT|nr:hypothetical protein [Luteolibacter flavescens]MCW1883109.1 hypothetical protein [Luteolibacter flavescens]